MRQVPNMSNESIKLVLVGNGRLALHLSSLFDLTGIPFKKIINSRFITPNDINNLYLTEHEETYFWLAISDDALIEIATKIQKITKNAKFIHSSGVQGFKNFYKFHPLFSFSNQLYLKEKYFEIPWALNELSNQSNLKNIFSFIHKSFLIEDKNAELYHALAVVSSNFPAILWAECKKLSEENGIPFQIYLPLVLQTLENISLHGSKALTGPLVRNDEDTIRKHLQILNSKQFDNLYKVFQSFVKQPNKERSISL